MNGTVRKATVRNETSRTIVSLRHGARVDVKKGDVLAGWLNEYGNFYNEDEIYLGSLGHEFTEINGDQEELSA